MIDYPTAIFMQGGELAGVVVGVLLNILLPEIVTIILSAVVLGFNCWKTLQKAVAKRRSETQAFACKLKCSLSSTCPRDKAQLAIEASADEPKASKSPPPSSPEKVVLEPTADLNCGDAVVAVKCDLALSEKNLAKRILAERALSYPIWAWQLLILMVIFFIIYSMAIGQVFDNDYSSCNRSYWPVFLTPFIFYGLVIIYMARRNIQMDCRMREAGIDYVEGDIHWNSKSVAMLVPAAIGAGIAAGLLGIGGGMILGPIFVALDFQPQVGTATTGFMILFTAMGGTAKYLTIGKLPWRHLAWFGSIGVIGGQTGQRVVKRIIQKTGRPSYVVFILGGIIGLAVIVMTTFGIIRVIEDADCGVDVWKLNTHDFTCAN